MGNNSVKTVWDYINKMANKIREMINWNPKSLSFLIDPFVWAKVAYTIIILSIILIFCRELGNLWFDKKIYIRNFQFFDAGTEKTAQGKSLALQAISQHRKLVNLLAREGKKSTKSTNPENTWWPREVLPINNPESALSEIELTVQGINLTDILTRIRQWVSRPNEISALLDKNKNVVDAMIKWPQGPSKAKGKLVDGQLFYIEGKTDESLAIFHIACSLIWAQAASQQDNLSQIPRQYFCNWAEAWVDYISLRNKSQSIAGLKGEDIQNIKQIRKFLTQQLNQGNSYPEIYRLRADIIDLVPNDQRTQEELTQAQEDRIKYAILTDSSNKGLSPEELKNVTLARARPAIPVENIQKEGAIKNVSEAWDSVLSPHKEQIARAAKATGWGSIKQNNLPIKFSGFAVAPNIIATVNFPFAQFLDKDTNYPKVLDNNEISGSFSFEDKVNKTSKPSLQIKKILFASNNQNGGAGFFALLEIEGHDPKKNPPLVIEKKGSSISDFIDSYAFVVGYPAKDTRIPQSFLDELLKNQPGIKRIMPGRILSINPSSSNRKISEITSDMSTTAGTAGGPLVDLQTGRVLGIHYGGEWIKNPEKPGKFSYSEVFPDILELPNLPDDVKEIFNEQTVIDPN